MREGEPCRIITPIEPSWYAPAFWLIVLSIFLTVTCALWYVVFRAIGIVV